MNENPLTVLPTTFEGPQAPTMSSREIADLTGKEHRNVMRDIRNILETLGECTALSFERSYQDASGRSLPCYELPKRECTILVSGYDVVLRTRIIDRWLELEAASAPKLDLENPAFLRSLLLTHTAKAMEAQKQVEEMRPKVEAHDRIADAHGTFCRQTAAKMLGIPPNTLIRWMRTNGWTFRREGGKDDIGYQSKIVSGLLEHQGDHGVPRRWDRVEFHSGPRHGQGADGPRQSLPARRFGRLNEQGLGMTPSPCPRGGDTVWGRGFPPSFPRAQVPPPPPSPRR